MKTTSATFKSSFIFGLARCALAALLAFFANSVVAEPPPAPAGYAWQPIPQLTDDFDSASLDTNKWLDHHPYWSGRGSTFDPANVVVAGGCLNLLTTGSTMTNLRAACVTSKTSCATAGCYYEASIMASRLSMSSSFWFQGKYSEIDVAEEIGDSLNLPKEDRCMIMHTHFFKGGWSDDKYTQKRWTMPTGSADSFHEYGMWWKNEKMVWYYHDGKKVEEMATRGTFGESMHLFFDTEVFAVEGPPTLDSLKDPARNSMKVDWVRSWKLVKQ